MALFREAATAPAGSRVLDLACGDGRHLAPLRDSGYRPVGLDLSKPLLERAGDREGGNWPLVRGDMRWLPFRRDSFSAVLLFFTSFGYFDDPADDRRVLAEARRVGRPGAALLLDYLNAPHVRRSLVPEDTRVVEGRTVRQWRRIEGDKVIKTIEVEAGEAGEEPEVYEERVRLYEPSELNGLLGDAGFRLRGRYGDYGGGPVTPDAPRLILVAEAR